jgi:hypothetical protein
MTIANPVTDLANGLLQIALDAIRAGERPDPLDTFFHHIPFVPQGQCCRDMTVTDDHPFGEEGYLTASATAAFPSTGFPAPRTVGDSLDTPGRPSAHLWLRLWRCFPTIDQKGQYDLAKATTASEALAQDLAIVWAGLQKALCAKVALAEITNGCNSAVLWEAKPVRIEAGCAGWEFHVIAAWPPLQFPPEP